MLRSPFRHRPRDPAGLPHRHDVLGRHVGLNVVDGVEDEAAAGRQIINASLDFVADLLRGAVRQHLLRIHAAAVKGQVLAEPLFEFLVVSMPAALTCTGFRMSMPDSIRSPISGRTAPERWNRVLTCGAARLMAANSRE